MLLTILTGLWSRKRRLFGTVTAVVLGVAFLAATLVIGDTQRADFSQAFTTANAGTDVIVRSASKIDGENSVRGLIDAGLVDQVAAADGVAKAVPSIEGTATILGSDGNRIGGDGPPTVAANWVDDPELNPYRLAEGRAPAADDEVVIDRATAENGDLAVGDRTTVLTPEPVEVTVVGIATFGDADSLGPITYTAFTLPTAQELLAGRPDAISSVLVAAEDGVSQETLRDEIMQLMPARIEALTQGELTAEQEEDIESDFLGVFNMMLLAFAGIAMVVAAFSIHNTFSILVAQRTRESALLRAIGASRRQVVVGVALEALVVGTVATAIGFGAGIGLATGLKQLFASADLALTDSGLVIDGGTIAIAAIVGIVTTLVASVVPALKASRVAPLAALRDVTVDRSAVSKTRCSRSGSSSPAPELPPSSPAHRAVMAPSAGSGSARSPCSSARSSSGRSQPGRLRPSWAAAPRSPVGSPVASPGATRCATLGASRPAPRRLMVGTGVVALFTTFGSSLKATIDDAVDNRFGGDLIVEQDGFSGAPLSPELAGAIAEQPEVADARRRGLRQPPASTATTSNRRRPTSSDSTRCSTWASSRARSVTSVPDGSRSASTTPRSTELPSVTPSR